jgi:hypothetical protein
MKKALFIILFSIGIDSVLAQQGLISISKTEKETAVAVDTKLTKIAAFPGGQTAFSRQIVNNFKTQSLVRANITQAHAIAAFFVETDGSIADIKIVSYENEMVKNEFLKALKSIKTKWIPAEENGKKVRSKMNQPLFFTL